MSIYEDLKNLENKITRDGYEIDRFEVRERTESYRNSKIGGRTAQRAVGRNPLQVLEDWESVDNDDYIIEVFLSGRNPLDRILYDPEKQKTEYIGFSSSDPSVEELLEE